MAGSVLCPLSRAAQHRLHRTLSPWRAALISMVGQCESGPPTKKDWQFVETSCAQFPEHTRPAFPRGREPRALTARPRYSNAARQSAFAGPRNVTCVSSTAQICGGNEIGGIKISTECVMFRGSSGDSRTIDTS